MLTPEDVVVPRWGFTSQGLAWKMVLMQLIQVNIMAWLIARLFGWHYEWIFQIVGLGTAIAAGWSVKLVAVTLLVTQDFTPMILSAVFYLIVMMSVIYLMPWLAGMHRQDLSRAVYDIMRAIARKY